jgi:hypothetical protein
METEVLTGATDTIRRLQPVLYVENDRDEKSSAVIGLIEALGYRAWWHFAPLFSAANFFGNPENVFERILSINLLCAPATRVFTVQGMAVDGPNDTWRAARDRMLAATASRSSP